MRVCAHGDVAEFCREHDMVICDTWDGNIENYRGGCRVLVSDQSLSENEYYFLKSRLMARGIELISTHHKDDESMVGFLMYANERDKSRHATRLPMGYCWSDGQKIEDKERMAVARRIIELRERGLTYREIRDDENVRRRDGEKLSLSTIQNVWRNKEFYKK
jgi:hypothetical protein